MRGELGVGGDRGGGRASAHRDKLVFVCPFAAAAATKTHFSQSRKAVMKSNEAAEEAGFDL